MSTLVNLSNPIVVRKAGIRALNGALGTKKLKIFFWGRGARCAHARAPHVTPPPKTDNPKTRILKPITGGNVASCYSLTGLHVLFAVPTAFGRFLQDYETITTRFGRFLQDYETITMRFGELSRVAKLSLRGLGSFRGLRNRPCGVWGAFAGCETIPAVSGELSRVAKPSLRGLGNFRGLRNRPCGVWGTFAGCETIPARFGRLSRVAKGVFTESWSKNIKI